MSKNCIHCIVNERTGPDLLCDSCRSMNANVETSNITNGPLLITPEMCAPIDTCRAVEINPIVSFKFPDGSELCWKTGEMKFTGNADEAAKVFFDNVVAIYAQQTERLRRVEKALRWYGYDCGSRSDYEMDEGKIARKALEQ